MKYDMVLAGLGGQGVVLMARILTEAACRDGLFVKQGEIHGMSQRGGSVQAQLRIADSPVASDLVGRGTADLIIALEPVEGLRYVDYLAPEGVLVTSVATAADMEGYPTGQALGRAFATVGRTVLLDAAALAREAGSTRAANMVMLGAAANLLPVAAGTLLDTICEAAAPMGEKAVETNRRAFRLGQEAARAEAVAG